MAALSTRTDATRRRRPVPGEVPPFPVLGAAPLTPAGDPGGRGPYQKSAQTRRRILDAAMEVFAAQGFRAGSLKEIGELAGLDHTSISHHFPTKAELLLAVMHERDRRADELIESLHPQTLTDIPGAFMQLAARNSATPGVIELYTVLAAESLVPEHPLGDYFRDRTRTLREGFESWFDALADEGALRDGVNPRIAASSFWALWEGVQLHWLIDRSEVDVVENLEHFLGLVLRDDFRSSTAANLPHSEHVHHREDS